MSLGCFPGHDGEDQGDRRAGELLRASTGDIKCVVMWGAVGQVTSVLSLAAFVVAAIVTILRHRLMSREQQLKAAPDGERAAVIQAVNDAFLVPSLPVDPTNLTRDQQYNLLIEQIRDRSRRFYVASVAVTVVALAGALVTLITLLSSGKNTGRPTLPSGTASSPDSQKSSVPSTSIPTTGSDVTEPRQDGRDTALLLGYDIGIAMARLEKGRAITQERSRINAYLNKLDLSARFPDDPLGPQDAFLQFVGSVDKGLEDADIRQKGAFLLGLSSYETSRIGYEGESSSIRAEALAAGFADRPDLADKDYLEYLVTQARKKHL
jgi:hypothetical protein